MRVQPVGQVLVVEDDADLRGVLRRTLEMEKWTVAEANNGLEALERIQTRIPSVILLDLLMPVMDGFAVLAELRKRDEWRQIPVVVITAKDLTQEERDRLRGQTEKILEKGSYVRADLLREVRNCVARFRAT
jgi:CheY-like chemotaxis protein